MLLKRRMNREVIFRAAAPVSIYATDGSLSPVSELKQWRVSGRPIDGRHAVKESSIVCDCDGVSHAVMNQSPPNCQKQQESNGLLVEFHCAPWFFTSYGQSRRRSLCAVRIGSSRRQGDRFENPARRIFGRTARCRNPPLPSRVNSIPLLPSGSPNHINSRPVSSKSAPFVRQHPRRKGDCRDQWPRP